MYKFFFSNLNQQPEGGSEAKRRTKSESSEDDGVVDSRKDSLDIPLRLPTRKRILSASRVIPMGGAYHRYSRSNKSKDVIRRWNSFHSTRAYECHPNRFKNPRRPRSPFRNVAVQSLFENRQIPLIDDELAQEEADQAEHLLRLQVKEEEVDAADEALQHIVENQAQIDRAENISTPAKAWALRRGQSLADRLQPLPATANAHRRLSSTWYVEVG